MASSTIPSKAHRNRITIAVAASCLIAGGIVWAQERGGTPRAPKPTFDRSETSSVFFDDVFSVLVGGRPDLREVADAGLPGGGTDPSSAGEAVASEWVQFVSAEALENEIKRLKLAVDQDVTTPSDFKGRGYRECRRHFTVVATVFAVINVYGGDVRWQEFAASARDVFARSAANTKVGTTQSYNESRLRKQDLQDLIGGGNFQGGPAEPENDWEQICDRSPLMQRLSIAFEETIQPAAGDDAALQEEAENLLHEAQIVSLIAHVLIQDGMEDGGDEIYDGYATGMRQGAQDFITALNREDYEAAREAVGMMSQACGDCHSDYQL